MSDIKDKYSILKSTTSTDLIEQHGYAIQRTSQDPGSWYMITTFVEHLHSDFNNDLPDQPWPEYFNGKVVDLTKTEAQVVVRAQGATENDGWIPVQ